MNSDLKAYDKIGDNSKVKPSKAYITAQDRHNSREFYKIDFCLWPQGDSSITLLKLRDTGFFSEIECKTVNDEIFKFWGYLVLALADHGYSEDMRAFLRTYRVRRRGN